MPAIALSHELDVAGWRSAARELRTRGVPPDEVSWSVEGDLFAAAPAPAGPAAFTVPKAFVDLADQVILNRAPHRFSLLYRLLWRMADEPALIANPADADITAARDMAKAVSRAAHKMKAFLRFRIIEGVEQETYAAWFEPAHRVTEAVAPFFAKRFSNMTWTIFTPDACVGWDRASLTFAPGADPSRAPREDAHEELWRTYYASIFNPARLNPRMMQQEMPKRYWRNLPEATLIPSLIASARSRTAEMVAAAATQPARAPKALKRHERIEPTEPVHIASLNDVAQGVNACRRCDLWREATQGVAGEGPANARLMIVGEQPGDQEDLAGRPFVGPAGEVFDRALAQAGVPRDITYITNAVKHFKHELRGKRRLHKTPTAGEVRTCRWWVDAERSLIRPSVTVALGATAALSVWGKPLPVNANRGKSLALQDGSILVVTFHPSAILRTPDAEQRKAAFQALADDLALAASLAT